MLSLKSHVLFTGFEFFLESQYTLMFYLRIEYVSLSSAHEVTDMAQTMEPEVKGIDLEISRATSRTKEDVRYRIAEIGIIPVVRVASEEDALFVAEALAEAGIPIVEISAAFPSAFHTISHLAERLPNIIVGAGSVLSADMARRCRNEGARFLTTDGLVLDVVEFAIDEGVVVFPGALTPTEIIAAWTAGADFVKVAPCNAMGGHNYIRSLKAAMPQVHLIAAGGVDHRTASNFITAGATALGVGRDLIPAEAIRLRQGQRIQELARRYLSSVDKSRN
jgi:2-dehydro-3-deoxyphosphogluconate aldolase/(4S)-4-hydroxy-2-oxoglutarate aldolase